MPGKWRPPPETSIPREPLPKHTPIPVDLDREIDRIAADLAACRPDLSPEMRATLASILAHRVRVFRRENPHEK